MTCRHGRRYSLGKDQGGGLLALTSGIVTGWRLHGQGALLSIEAPEKTTRSRRLVVVGHATAVDGVPDRDHDVVVGGSDEAADAMGPGGAAHGGGGPEGGRFERAVAAATGTRPESEHLLLIGTGAYYREVLSALERLDIASSVICVPSSLARLRPVTDHRFICCTPDKRAWIDVAAEIDRKIPVTGVICLVDSLMETAARIAGELGVRWHPAEVAGAVHDKFRMRSRLSQAGVRTVPAARVTSEDEVRAFGGEFGWPIILKPLRATGSLGVVKLSGPDDVAGVLERSAVHLHLAAADPEFMVESFIPGPQYSVETMSEDGDHLVVALTKKYSHPATLVEVGHALPVLLPAAELRVLEEYVGQVLNALGVEFGPTCTEIVWSDDGPIVFECQMRVAGDETQSLISHALDIDFIDTVVRQAAGQTVLRAMRSAVESAAGARAAAIWYAYSRIDGDVIDVLGTESAASVDGVVDVHWDIAKGDKVNRFRHYGDRYAHAVAVSVTYDEAVERAQSAAAALRLALAVEPETSNFF